MENKNIVVFMLGIIINVIILFTGSYISSEQEHKFKIEEIKLTEDVYKQKINKIDYEIIYEKLIVIENKLDNKLVEEIKK